MEEEEGVWGNPKATAEVYMEEGHAEGGTTWPSGGHMRMCPTRPPLFTDVDANRSSTPQVGWAAQ